MMKEERFILGIGIAGITCTTFSLIPGYYEEVTRARVHGYQAAAMGFGVLILELSGGFPGVQRSSFT